MSTKRVLVVSDLHCGHRSGLTPPAYNSDAQPFRKQRDFLWQTVKKKLKQIGPIDYVFSLGDLIDGKGSRSKQTELLAPDMFMQCEMATEFFHMVRQNGSRNIKMVGVRGTPYHCGDGEDFEDIIARDAGFEKMGDHDWPQIHNTVFDIKHKIGGSSIPHGRWTALARSAMWNEMWANRELQPRADVLLRAHVHYSVYGGDDRKMFMTLPALQGHGSKYGSRQCEGLVNWGFSWFDVGKNGYSWDRYIPELDIHKAVVTKL